MSVHLRGIQDVPDLVQEVYLRMLRAPDQGSILNLEAYLFTVAGHVVRQHLLRQSINGSVIDIVEAEADPELQSSAEDDPAARAENAQRVERFVEHILARLPPRVAAALVLHRIYGYTLQETADQMGVTRETAKWYMAEAARRCLRTGHSGAQDE